MKTIKKSISLFLLVIMLAGILLGCGAEKSNEFQKQEDVATQLTLADLQDGTIAIINGTIWVL